MAKKGIKKTPTPADPQAEQPAKEVPVEVLPAAPAAPPPPPREYRPVVQQADPIEMPRSPEEVVHNVMVRQVADDIRHKPEEDDEQLPALTVLEALHKLKDAGESVAPLSEDLQRMAAGMEAETKATLLAFLNVKNRELMGWSKSGNALNKLLMRLCNRGDLKPHEAIVLKRLQVQEEQSTVTHLLNALEKGYFQLPDNATTSMDFHAAGLDTTKVHKNFSKMTPQGREIYRKILVRARSKMFPQGKPDEKPK